MLENAIAAGVIDGASFASLVNMGSLYAWGVRSRVTLRKMQTNLEALRCNYKKYDPYVSNGKEVGQAAAIPSPNGFKNSSDAVKFEFTGQSVTDENGFANFNIQRSGTYVFCAIDPLKEPYCSLAFQIDCNQNKLSYTSYVRPMMCRVTILVSVPQPTFTYAPLGFDSGVLVSLVDLTSGRRIYVICRSDTQANKSSYVLGTSGTGTGTPTEQTTTSTTSGGSSNSNRKDDSPSVRTSSGLMPRLGRSRHAATPVTPTVALVQKKVVLWLPVSHYLCETTGTVLMLEARRTGTSLAVKGEGDDIDADQARRLQNLASMRKMQQSFSFQTITNLTRPIVDPLLITYDAWSAYKCHRRHLRKTVVKIQRIYRLKRDAYIKQNSKSLEIIKSGMLRLLYYVRRKIRKRMILRLQNWVKGEVCRGRFQFMKKQMIKVQSLYRRKKAISKVNKMRLSRRLLAERFANYCKKRRLQKHSAIVIQCAYRSFRACRVVEGLRYRKRWKVLCRLSAQRGQQYIKQLIQQQNLRRQEQLEREAAEAEMRILKEREERERLDKLLEEELTQNNAATIIQSLRRGYLARCKYRGMAVKRRSIFEEQRMLIEEEKERALQVSATKILLSIYRSSISIIFQLLQ